jgi:hypothetical protein
LIEISTIYLHHPENGQFVATRAEYRRCAGLAAAAVIGRRAAI